MCKNPIDHDGIPVWCRKCDECRDAYINDWAGRCMAESRYTNSAHSVSLTYGRDDAGNVDHVHAAVLMYSDVQKFFKSLRRAGYVFKYLVAGEYGEKRHRSHWHLLIFWAGKVPDVVLEQNTDFEYWPHGHTFWQELTYKSVRYVTKYVQKETGDEHGEAMLRMSKKPPLGHEWFQWWAGEHVRLGVAPRSLHYNFDGVNLKNGNRRQFYMRGVTAENFLKGYCRAFYHDNGHFRFPESALLEEWLDGKYAAYFEAERWIGEKLNGKITEVYKRSLLTDVADQKYGGVRFYLPPVSKQRDALALCHDGTVLEYGRPEANPADRFFEILEGSAGREFSITTSEGS